MSARSPPLEQPSTCHRTFPHSLNIKDTRQTIRTFVCFVQLYYFYVIKAPESCLSANCKCDCYRKRRHIKPVDIYTSGIYKWKCTSDHKYTETVTDRDTYTQLHTSVKSRCFHTSSFCCKNTLCYSSFTTAS